MNHENLANRIERIAMATGILAGLSAAAAAFLVEPTGFDAIGVWLGIIDEPLVIQAAPILDKVATASGALSGFTYFLVYWKKIRSNIWPRKMIQRYQNDECSQMVLPFVSTITFHAPRYDD